MTGTGEPPQSWVPSSAGSSPTKRPVWFRRHWKDLAIGALALLVGAGLGAAGNTGNINKKDNQIKAQAAQIQDLTAKNADLQKQVGDRATQTAADNAHVAAFKADEQAAKDKAAADARAKAAAAAAAAKAKADAAAAAKAQASASAAAAAKAQADAAAKAQADANAAAAAAAAQKNTIAGDGVYAIGADVNPGQWRSSGGTGCYYAILNSPDTNDIATNNLNDGPAIADLPLGKYFDTTSCGSWTHS